MIKLNLLTEKVKQLINKKPKEDNIVIPNMSSTSLILLDSIKETMKDPSVINKFKDDISHITTLQDDVLLGATEERESLIKKLMPDAIFIHTMEELTNKYIPNDYRAAMDSEDKSDILTNNLVVVCENRTTGKKALGIAYPFLGIGSLYFEEYFFIGNEIIYFYTQEESFMGLLADETNDTKNADDKSRINGLLQMMETKGISDLHIYLANEYSYEITGRVTSEKESISKGVPINIPVIDSLLEGLITRAQQDPFVKKPEIRGLVKHKVTTPSGGKIDRTFRIHIIDQSSPPSVGSSTSIRKLMTFKELTRMNLDDMGYIKEANTVVNRVLDYADTGIVVVSGATNSGKSTFLYKLVEMLIHENKRVIAVENPIEIPVPGLIQIDLKKTEDASDDLKVTLVKAIGYLMSHDPDVGLINEVRYIDEIKELINLALKGHLAATTMHSNDIKACLTTLQEATGGDSQAQGTFRLFINQKLVDTKCQVCLGKKILDKPCSNCNGRGVKGKVALPEVLYFKQQVRPEDDVFNFDKLVEDGIAEYYPRMYFAKHWYDLNKLTEKDWNKVKVEAGMEL
jgi:Tfp pilus assembly pilus retraction ATPase PilT